MKMHVRISLLIILALLTIQLASIALVKADPIGDTLQSVPLEVSPTATLTGSAGSVNPDRCRDKDYEGTYTQFAVGATPSPTYFGAMTFERASDLGVEPEPTIGWVDLKIKWQVPALTDDWYRFEYAVSATAPAADWTPLYDVTGAAGYTDDVGSSVIAMPWHNVAEPNDGIWTWADIVNTQVRVMRQAVGTTDGKLLKLYEIWMTVYPDTVPLPPAPTDGVGLSIQPPAIAPIPEVDEIMYLPGKFFVDIYARGITTPGLAGWEASFNFNTTALTPSSAFTYYPWTFPFAKDLVDVDPADATGKTGFVHLSFLIADSANPFVDTGLAGTFPIARVYFAVDPVYWDPYTLVLGPSPLHWLSDRIFKLNGPGAVDIPFSSYDGYYGIGPIPEFPLGIGILMAIAPLIPIVYIWRLRKRSR